MKKIVSFLLTILIIFSANITCGADSPTAQEYKEIQEQLIWDYLMQYFNNPYGVAVIIGNMTVESGCIPFRCESDRDYENLFAQSRSYTNKINEKLKNPNEKTKYEFAWEGAKGIWGTSYGYGLCQWTYWRLKEQMYELAVETERSIDDYTLQCDYLIWDLENRPGLENLLELLKTTKNISNAAAAFRSTYERPVYNEISIYSRAKISIECYERYTGEKYTKKIHHNYWLFGTYDESLVP